MEPASPNPMMLTKGFMSSILRGFRGRSIVINSGDAVNRPFEAQIFQQLYEINQFCQLC
jgi:hypothetical protein